MQGKHSLKRTAALLTLLVFALVTRAEQIRVAVTLPIVVGETNGAGGQAALWQSLVMTELSRYDWVALVEREDLPRLATERALMAGHTTNSNVASGWVGADCVVLTQWQRQNGTNRLALKILDVEQGGIEKEFTREFSDDQMEAAAGALAKELHAAGLELLSRRQIHTAVSVLDFESQSRFARGRWQEHALARQLRNFLKQQPGVLVLEREDVEALLRETRLQRGGMASAGTALTNSWTTLRNYPLVSGTIEETQPEGSPLTVRITTRIRDLADGRTNEFTETFPVEQWAASVARIEQQVNLILHHGGSLAAARASLPDRSSEALALVGRALRLSTWPEISTYKGLIQRNPHGLLSYSERERMFSYQIGQRIIGSHTPWRRTQILQSCQYLKSSVLADDRNPQIRLLLASLLVDSQVNEPGLAVELAEEVGWQFPEHRLAAWAHAYDHSTGPQKERLLRLLIQYFPESDYARIPAQKSLTEFIQKHRSDADQTALIDALRPDLDQKLAETPDGLAIEGPVTQLFQLTQISGRNPTGMPKDSELQTPKNQARGVALLEEMIQKHPNHAFFLCHFWSKGWDDFTKDEAQTWIWFRRAAELTPAGPLTKYGNNSWWDHRLKLIGRLMERHQYEDARFYLEKINQQDLLEGDRDMMMAQCCFELGDYQRALILFRAFGPDHKPAAKLAAECERKLNRPPATAPPKNYRYAVVTNRSEWRVIDLPLPAHTEIHAVAADAENLWLGLMPPEHVRDNFLPQLQDTTRAQRPMQAMLERRLANTGGLLGWNRTSGETRLLTPENGLPHPWVWSLAVTPEGLWVGSSGGLALFKPSQNQWTAWTETNGLPMNQVRSLAADEKNLWVGMGNFNRGAVARLDLRAREWREFLPADYPAKTNFPSPMNLASSLPEYMKKNLLISYVPVTPVTTLAVMNGRLWCALPGTQTEGCVWVSSPANPQPVKVVRANFEPHGTVCFSPASNHWYSVCDDAPVSMARVNDRLWFSLGNAGLTSCDLQGGNWQRITSADGLPMPAGPIREWRGRLLIAGDGLMVLDEEHKRFEVYPFPTPGGAGLMTVTGDQVYLVRGNQILSLDIATLPHSNPAEP